MKKFYTRTLMAFFLSGSSIAANAYEVIVKSDQNNLSSFFEGCKTIKGGCSEEISQVLKIINSNKFQSQLDFNQSNQFEISFSPEIYRLKNTINIMWNNKVKLILQGVSENNNQTIISGAIQSNLNPLGKNDPNFSKIPQNIRPYIYTANFPVFAHGQVIGFKHPTVPTSGELFWNNQAAILARWPNQDFVKIGTVNVQNNIFTLNDFHQKITDTQLQAHGFWANDWADQTYPIVQDANNTNKFKVLINTATDYGMKAGQRVYLENALELLDSPGEWYQDYKTGTVYFWLPDKTKKTVEFSSLENLLNINNSKNIEINNIGFEKNRANAILINNSQLIDFNSVYVCYTGNSGVEMKGGHDNIINNSKIINTGNGGVFVNAGDRVNLISSNIKIQNSYFNNNDRIVFTYQPAISLMGVGQIVQNNTIENNGHTAILYQGNNHLISNNKISNVLKITSDAGAIYTGRDFTSRGTVIKNNTISNILPFRKDGSVVGVYLDDQASGITVKNNEFINVQYGVQLGGGRNNIIQNNVFENNTFSIRYDARGTTWQKAGTHDSNGIIMKNLNSMPIHSPIWEKQYPNLANILNDDFGKPKYNIIEGNQFIHSGTIRFESGLYSNNTENGATISSNIEEK